MTFLNCLSWYACQDQRLPSIIFTKVLKPIQVVVKWNTADGVMISEFPSFFLRNGWKLVSNLQETCLLRDAS